MKILSWIIPGLIVFAVFYFGKPSDEKCKQIAIEKMAGYNINAAPNEIIVDDKLVLKTILYNRGNETLNIGNGFFFIIRMKEHKLKNLRKTGN